MDRAANAADTTASTKTPHRRRHHAGSARTDRGGKADDRGSVGNLSGWSIGAERNAYGMPKNKCRSNVVVGDREPCIASHRPAGVAPVHGNIKDDDDGVWGHDPTTVELHGDGVPEREIGDGVEWIQHSLESVCRDFFKYLRGIFKVPMCAVSLVEHNLVCINTGSGVFSCPRPRAGSLCDWILSNSSSSLHDEICVTNTSHHEKFRAVQYVEGPPYIKLYAQCPIAFRGHGPFHGAVTLLDVRSRNFGRDEMSLMYNIGSLIGAELDTTAAAGMGRVAGPPVYEPSVDPFSRSTMEPIGGGEYTLSEKRSFNEDTSSSMTNNLAFDTERVMASDGKPQAYKGMVLADVHLGPMIERRESWMSFQGRQQGMKMIVKKIPSNMVKLYDSEAARMLSFCHENLLTLYPVAFWDAFGVNAPVKTPCFMEECDDYGSLHDFLLSGRTTNGISIEYMTEAVIASIARDVARGIQYLHAHGFLHGTLTTKNVVLTSDQNKSNKRWKAAISLVSKFSKDSIIQHVEPGGGTTMYGAHGHLPPEVLLGRHLDESTDIYSFGVLIWEMWQGMQVWPHLSAGSILQFVGIEGKTLPEPESMPRRLRVILRRCLQQQYDSRPSFDSIVPLLSDYCQILAGQMPL